MRTPTPHTSDDHDDVLVTRAAWEINLHVGRRVPAESVLKSARRINAVKRGDGRYTTPRAVVEMMKKNYASVGYLVRRGQRSVEGVG